MKCLRLVLLLGVIGAASYAQENTNAKAMLDKAEAAIRKEFGAELIAVKRQKDTLIALIDEEAGKHKEIMTQSDHAPVQTILDRARQAVGHGWSVGKESPASGYPGVVITLTRWRDGPVEAKDFRPSPLIHPPPQYPNPPPHR